MNRNVPLTSQLGCNLPTKDRNLPDGLPPELVDRPNSYRRWHERHNSIKTKLTLCKKCPNTEFFLFCFYMISGKHIKKPIFRWFIYSGLKKELETSLMWPEAYLRPFQTSTMKASWKTSKDKYQRMRNIFLENFAYVLWLRLWLATYPSRIWKKSHPCLLNI